jgi:hypothetical protein
MDQYNNIFINRVGKTYDSFMKTIKLVDIIEPYSKITFTNNKLILNDKESNIENPKELNINSIEINGNFIESFLDEETNNNILGKNYYFVTNINNIIIPETITTPEALDFFGCKLIKNNDIFNLNYDKELPLFEVSIGKNYVNGYLLQKNYGNGFYIEKHNTPHYHQPLNEESSGYLIIGLILNNNLILTKFKISYGYAVYMSPNTLHCDAFLIGDYNVVYTKTPDYSTYLFIDIHNNIVNVQ